ncbi:MAG: FtsQ-type POTRA domain-containing protein [Lachnospiraceae bacterium]|jgi:cell division protein FtsQ|nr:FtsQ-type POTRA domain-containing protein [Lachnospiraceae bacterium]
MRARDLEHEGGGLLRWMIGLLGVVIICAIIFLFIYFGCGLKTVEVTGNEIHTNEEIKEIILNDDYSWNSVYVFLKYKFKKPKTLPFVDTMEIQIKSPSKIQIHVYEKNMIGYLYVNATGQYAYIDKDGIVEELSTRIVDNVVELNGLEVKDVKLYETLKTENPATFKNLLALTNTLEKYKRLPKKVSVFSGMLFTLYYGDITVNFGSATNLNEKMVRMDKILPQLEGMKGTLHMEDWRNEDSDITFQKEKSKQKKG